jgi:peptidoglycan/LPS O-acetylase OafA/YrhL
MFFYAVFPMAALFIRRANWRSIALAAAIACCMTRFMWAAGVSDNIKPLVHLSDFLMGIAAACAYGLLQRHARPPRGWWFYIPGLAGAAAVIAYPAILPPFIDLNSALRPLNGVLLIGLALGGGALARALSTPVAVYLGKSATPCTFCTCRFCGGACAGRRSFRRSSHCHRKRHICAGIWRVRRAG